MQVRLGVMNGMIRPRSGWIRLGWSWGVRWKPVADGLCFSQRGTGQTIRGVWFGILEPLTSEQAAHQRSA